MATGVPVETHNNHQCLGLECLEKPDALVSCWKHLMATSVPVEKPEGHHQSNWMKHLMATTSFLAETPDGHQSP